MNAKKIMGAVLVALLAAALFVGAASAADGTDYGTVFIYQAGTAVPAGVWTLVGGTAAVDVVTNSTSGTDIMPGADFVAGTYKLGDDTVYFCKPTASYALTGTVNQINYIVANGGKVYNDSKLEFKINALNSSSNSLPLGIYITNPDGTTTKTTTSAMPWTSNGITSKGTTKVQVIFDESKFVKGTPEGLFLDENYFTFTVVEAEDATISASVDTAFSGEVITFVVEGTPGEQYNVTLKGFDLPSPTNALQEFVNYSASGNALGGVNFTVGNSGVFTFKATVNSSTLGDNDDKNKAVAELQKYSTTDNKYKTLKNGKITIKISAPVVTAKVGADSYFIGDEIEISGTSSAKTEYTFNISGINFKSTVLTIDESEFGKEWNAVLLTNNVKELGTGKKLDVGTYTIEIIGKDGSIVKTVPVVLKQPFISIISAPEVVVQGTDAEFVINAEATNLIAAYIFGTNYFKNFSMDYGIEVADEDIPNQFTLTLDKDADTNKTKMAAGQYFMVIQHPMYDGALNVTVDANGIFWVTTGSGSTSKLFDVNDRQTANAAQALCDALDSQNFDDMYVKYSFFVVGQDESFVINAIPTEVAQGTTFTVSGVDTANAGETVTVQMLSTAFAAVPKETAGSAAFILVTTEVADDGTWEVTLDTTGLAVDEYNLAVKIANEEKKTVKINVVEGADEPVNPEQPEQPENPENPTEPEAPATPGFGALAALAGLGAVAVLLLRRE